MIHQTIKRFFVRICTTFRRAPTTKLKSFLVFVWLIFAILFFMLGWSHWIRSKYEIPPFTVTTLVDESKGKVNIFDTAIDKPLKDFAYDFNKYLDEQNKTNRETNSNAAYGYFLAALTAVISMVIEIASLLRLRSGQTRS